MAVSLVERDRPPARPPRPELRVNLVGTLAATSLAFIAYLAALFSDVHLPEAFSGVLLAVAPACAIPATMLLAVRARAEQDESLRAVTAGLAVACVGMVLQLIAFRAVSPGGGVFATSSAGTALLFITWHAALPAGALASTLGRPRKLRRRIGLAVGVIVQFVFATALPSSFKLVHDDGSYTGTFLAMMLVLIVFIGAVLVRWVHRTGLRPTVTRGWITIAMVLSVYDVGLNAIGHQRFSDIWWASLTIRAATYAVLLVGLIVGTATQLQRLERYTSRELERAEGEVNTWIEVTERLLTATSALSAAVTADDVAVLLSAAGTGAIEFDDAVIYLVDATAGPGRLRLVGGVRSGQEGADGWAPKVEAAVYADTLRSGSARFFSTAAEVEAAFPDGAGQPDGRAVHALAVLPLVAGDVPIGVMVVAGPRRHDFRDLERELLAALVRVGAQALQRALLYEEQSSLATTLQEALLPQSLPSRPDVELAGRYLPATAGVDVGGDWYDVLELDSGALLLVVGDVMGKGVPAATLMGQMRSAVRTLAAVDPDPAAILSGLDQLATGFAADDIVTLVIVALDPASGRTVIANAGHLPPLVFTPGAPGRAATSRVNSSPPIGVPVTGPRASSQSQLPPGAALLLLTDGLVEERATDIDDRLNELTDEATELLAEKGVRLEDVADTLVHPRVHRDDDVTILLARLQPSAAQHAPAAVTPSRLLHVELDHEPGAAATARRLVREAVLADGGGVQADVLDALLLVTSELVTNGLRHGEPPVVLTLERRGARLRLTVTDTGAAIPRPRVAGPDSLGGRGLFLVAALAAAWKIEPHGERPGPAGAGSVQSRPGLGTSVWAEFVP